MNPKDENKLAKKSLDSVIHQKYMNIPTADIRFRRIPLPKAKNRMAANAARISENKSDFPLLVSAYFKGFGEMKANARKKLFSLTARDLGTDRAAWIRFYEENKHLEIDDWRKAGLAEAGIVIDGLKGKDLLRVLIEGLVQEEYAVRIASYTLLLKTAGRSVAAYMPESGPKALENGRDAWLRWLENQQENA
jgi:hypothetical protein